MRRSRIDFERLAVGQDSSFKCGADGHRPKDGAHNYVSGREILDPARAGFGARHRSTTRQQGRFLVSLTPESREDFAMSRSITPAHPAAGQFGVPKRP